MEHAADVSEDGGPKLSVAGRHAVDDGALSEVEEVVTLEVGGVPGGEVRRKRGDANAGLPN